MTTINTVICKLHQPCSKTRTVSRLCFCQCRGFGAYKQNLFTVTYYKKHIEQGNLLVIRLEPFCKRAKTGGMEPFYDLKAMLEAILKERIAAGKKAEAAVMADCADMFSRSEKFDECIFVERWWHNAYTEWLKRSIGINVVCPHPCRIFEQKKSFMQYKQQISRLHSLTVSAAIGNGGCPKYTWCWRSQKINIDSG